MNSNEQLLLPRFLFKEEIGGGVVVFNPESMGHPLFVQNEISSLFDQRNYPASFNRLLTLMPSFMTDHEKRELVTFFCDRGIIVRQSVAQSNKRVPSSGEMQVWFHVTNQCNLKCPYCFVHKTKGSIEKQNIDVFIESLLKNVSQALPKNVTIKFAGGEPLIRMDLMKYIIQRIGDLNKTSVPFHYAIISNGTLLTREKTIFLKDNHISISISLDGYGASHDRTRVDLAGNGSFKKIETNIMMLREMGISPFILATIGIDSIDQLPELTQWLLDNNLYARYNFVRYKDFTDSDYVKFSKRIVVAMDKSAECIKQHAFGPSFAVKLKIANLSFYKPLYGQVCGIAKSHIVLNHCGKLSLCPMTLESSVGDPQDGIAETYKNFEPIYKMLTPKDSSCLTCQWQRVCGTGCPVLNQWRTGHPNSRSPFCLAYKALIPMYVHLHGWALSRLGSGMAGAA